LIVNLAVSAIAFLFGGFNHFLMMIATLGFVSSIGFKETYRQNEYLFYMNNGLSKRRLLFCSLLLNFVFVFLFSTIWVLIQKLS
jgi:hypothetical protein